MFFLILLSPCLIAQTNLRLKIVDEQGNPLSKVIVVNTEHEDNAITDESGVCVIKVFLSDLLKIQKLDYEDAEFRVEKDDMMQAQVQVTLKKTKQKERGVREIQSGKPVPKSGKVALSSKNYWIGASLGYNIGGTDIEDLVGSAKIMMNPFNGKIFGGDFGVIGNFSNFLSVQNKEETDKNLTKILQSTQGLSFGLAGIWDLHKAESKVHSRFFYSLTGRLNAFKNVGADSINVNLYQFRNSVGVELETLEFKNGGALTFAIEATVGMFDQKKYEKIFNERKNSLTSLETSVVIPFSSNVGLLTNGTFSQGTKPIFQFGLIFKNIEPQKDQNEN